MAFTQPGQYGPEGLIDTAGNSLAGSTVTLVPSTGVTVTEDEVGNVTVHGPPGTYTMTIQPPNSGSTIVRTIVIPPDPDELASIVAGLNTQLAGEASARTAGDAAAVPGTQKGAPNGVATLDGTGHVPDTQIPATIARDSEVTAAVSAAVAALVASAPGALDTLAEIDAQLAADESAAAALTTALANEGAFRVAGDTTTLNTATGRALALTIAFGG